MYSVMLLDDEPWALAGLGEIMDWAGEGFAIEARMTDSVQALEWLREHAVDLVFTDIRMPYLSGVELMECARREQIPCEFVVVSAHSEFDLTRQVIQVGALDYILKPFKKEEILCAVRRLRERLGEKKRAVGWDACEQALPSDGLCYVLLCGDAPPDIPGVRTREISLPDGGKAQLATSAQPIESALQACAQAGVRLGASRPRRDFSARDEMLRDAAQSLEGGFLFAQNVTIAAIQSYIAENLGVHLSLQEIAKRFYLSKPYLCDLFKRHTGQNVMLFLTAIRMRRAAALLRGTDRPISEIAELTGYANQCYFGKVFRAHYGVTPSAYRTTLGTASSMQV